jgi:hypothetical protein
MKFLKGQFPARFAALLFDSFGPFCLFLSVGGIFAPRPASDFDGN